jgi:hypothetical protein
MRKIQQWRITTIPEDKLISLCELTLSLLMSQTSDI